MQPEGSMPNSQELSTCSYPEPDQSSPTSPHPTSPRSILNIYVLVFLAVSVPLAFPPIIWLSGLFIFRIYLHHIIYIFRIYLVKLRTWDTIGFLLRGISLQKTAGIKKKGDTLSYTHTSYGIRTNDPIGG
jgi:hypothetical protein